MTSFSKIFSILHSEQVELSFPDSKVVQLFYDSRLVANVDGGLFFAFSGNKGDGHRFIPQLAQKGLTQWIISDPIWAEWLRNRGGQNWILVEDVLSGFQTITSNHRSQYTLPVIGITGSNGKTIVKEWLAQLIGSDYFICKSPKSFNSQIGVGLSVWNLSKGHTLGIFEAGISHTGEMENLRNMILPNLGILTSLGPAHEEGFNSLEEKLKEKISLFSETSDLILSDALFARFSDSISGSCKQANILTWKWEKEVLSIDNAGFFLHFKGTKIKFQLPYVDDASLENLGNSISMALHLNVESVAIQSRLSMLSLPEMRLSLKEGSNGNVIVDDTYTNDLAGLAAALQFANLQRKAGQTLVLVLSNLEESILTDSEIQNEIGSLSVSFEINNLLTIGSQFEKTNSLEPWNHLNFQNSEDLLNSKIYNSFKDSVILVKGARRFGLEILVKAWQKKVHGTHLEINLDAMVNNLNFYKSQLPANTGIMAMVKAMSYGSGGEEIARILEYHHVNYLAVAYADEGIKLREAGIKLPILVLNPMPEALQSLIDYNLEPEIYGFRILNLWIELVKSQTEGPIPPIHIKLETGMHRLGFFEKEIDLLIEILNQNPTIKLATVFSHLAGADDQNLDAYSLKQIEIFETVCQKLKEKLKQNFKKHILNSAGILRFQQATYDFVRLGIGLYGVEVNSWFQNQLEPVSKFKTTISQIKTLNANETVGYGRKGKLLKDSKIATIAIGYADGFRREFSQGAVQVKINNQWAPVVGNVCMDMTMVDVTEIAAEEGDEVVIFEDIESLMKLAKAANTIPYEILTGIGQRVKRIFFRL